MLIFVNVFVVGEENQRSVDRCFHSFLQVFKGCFLQKVSRILGKE